ncbi:hypothetical protein N865_14315 [Intrasporangium oryzae NRRL B-24470]|uniref:Alpha-amylase n=1 Tax=Intrasporangium oryzae NRRL B-24470 TaxID=1386089 RepID=W9G740_9MICO|nr:hypothetical protein N865_14315 [Intrasporangium oryzae NRRL B-24470]
MAVAGALLAFGAVSAPAHAEPAALSGTVTAADTGQPLQACVTVYDLSYSWVDSACTDDAGHWSVASTEAGVAYKVAVQAFDGKHVEQWAGGASSFENAAEYVAPATADAALALGGTISGTLTRADGSQGYAWIDVSKLDSGEIVGGASTWDGTWSALVPSGDYVVSFHDGSASQYAYGSETREGATTIHVEAGRTAVVDDTMLGAATVSGVITSDVDGAPVARACVEVKPYPVVPDGWGQGYGCTDDTGTYSIDLSAAGTYTTLVTDPEGRFVAEYNGNTTVAADAAPFTVTHGATTRVDTSLAKASSITGLAVDGKTGAPIEGVCPDAYVGHNGGFAQGQAPECSGSDGRWTLRGLGKGDYALFLSGAHHTSYMAGTWAFKADSQATADLITVGAGENKAIRNVKLAPGGQLSGRITDPFGNPLEGAWVSAEGNTGGRAGPGEGRYVAQTDADGRYTIIGIPAGDYTPVVYAVPWGNLAPEWSGDADTPTDATPITVKATKTSTFDAQLGPAARLTGTVVNSDGSATTEPWDGSIIAADGTIVGSFDVWGGNSFASTALPGGEFKLQLENPDTGQVVWYDSASSSVDATVVPLARGEQKQITIHLP